MARNNRGKRKSIRGFHVETVEGGLSLDGGQHFVPWTRGEQKRGTVAIIDGIEFNDSPSYDGKQSGAPALRSELEIRRAVTATEPKR